VSSGVDDLVSWLETVTHRFDFDVVGLKRRENKPHYPLPTEPGALAHLIESRAAAFLQEVLAEDRTEITFRRGGERSYPDVELSNGVLQGQLVALDIKTARRGKKPSRAITPWRTDSRISLLTGNTYFATPDRKRGGALRPYGDYSLHLDWIIIFSIDVNMPFPEVTDLEQVIAETWQIASTSRSSTTRNYIGAVNAISDLREKRGAFTTQEEFENYWRSFNWTKKASGGGA
jgi:hypothetical protein